MRFPEVPTPGLLIIEYFEGAICSVSILVSTSGGDGGGSAASSVPGTFSIFFPFATNDTIWKRKDCLKAKIQIYFPEILQ